MTSKKDISPDVLGSLPKGFFEAAPKKANIRLLRVAEEIRKILSELFIREEVTFSFSESCYLTIEEVDVSPDLKHAKVYISFFTLNSASIASEEVLEELQEATPRLRYLLGQKIHLKFTPNLSFKMLSH